MIDIEYDGDTSEYLKILKAAERHLTLSGKAYIELDFCGKDEIRQINKHSRGVDSATDVLSFPFLNEIHPFYKKNYPLDYNDEKKSVLLGSIIICREIAAEQAVQYGHSVKRENAYLFLHGFLHLLGYDHMNEEEKQKMRTSEEEILRELNLQR